MKKLAVAWIAVALLACASTGVAEPAFTLDFEGIPIDYNYWGGHQNLGDYYAAEYGVHFGPNVVTLDRTVGGYNYYGYPPHSGTAVIRPYTGEYFDITLDQSAYSVGLWYSTGASVWLKAYDSTGNLLDSAYGARNYMKSSPLTVSDGSGRIARVRLSDGGNLFVADDISVQATPEPCTLILLGCSGVVIGILRRRHSA